MEWITFAEKSIWFGLAAIGFSILFNVPRRALLSIFLIGAAGGIFRLLLLQQDVNIILATLAGATLIGSVSIWAAHNKHTPPLVFAIPAVIPMVPGVFAYRMMIGIVKLSGTLEPGMYTQVLSETITYGIKVMFILMALAGGVALPMLITRKESAKHIRFRRIEDINEDENSNG
jgi:uncharacterized membrane protein YjjB (DUF3815 family)